MTAPDNLWIGEALAQTVFAGLWGFFYLRKKLEFSAETRISFSMQQRLGSVKKLLEDENIEPVWIFIRSGGESVIGTCDKTGR